MKSQFSMKPGQEIFMAFCKCLNNVIFPAHFRGLRSCQHNAKPINWHDIHIYNELLFVDKKSKLICFCQDLTLILDFATLPFIALLHNFSAFAVVYWVELIIIVINMWSSEKPSQKNNSDIRVIRVSDLFRWVMFMQNLELDVKVFNH